MLALRHSQRYKRGRDYLAPGNRMIHDFARIPASVNRHNMEDQIIEMRSGYPFTGTDSARFLQQRISIHRLFCVNVVDEIVYSTASVHRDRIRLRNKSSVVIIPFDEILIHSKEIYDMQSDADLGAELRRQSHLYAIFGALLRSSDTTDTNARVARAIGYMETNYPNPISVEQLADVVGLERTYLSTLFKEHTGTTPHAYLTSVRIKMAAELIRTDRYSMSEIAEAVGLAPQNFARIFRREIGVTPLEYKRAHANAQTTENTV